MGALTSGLPWEDCSYLLRPVSELEAGTLDIENCITWNEEGPKCGGFVDSVYSVGANSLWCYPRGWSVDGEAVTGLGLW